MTSSRRLALVSLAVAGLLWGMTVPLTKVALGAMEPGWLTVARFGVAGVMLAAVLRRRLAAACSAGVLGWGAVGYGGAVLLQNIGMGLTSVSHGALLVGCTPVLVAVISAVWLRSVATPLAWCGLAASMLGVVGVSGAGGGDSSLVGDAIVFAGIAVSAVFAVVQSRLLPGRDVAAVTAVQFLAVAVGCVPLAFVLDGAPVVSGGAGESLAVVALAVAGTLVPFTLFAYGQSIVPPEVAGAFINFEPVVGVALGMAVFGDPAGVVQFVFGSVVVLGIVVSSLPTPRRPTRRPGPVTPERAWADEPAPVAA